MRIEINLNGYKLKRISAKIQLPQYISILKLSNFDTVNTKCLTMLFFFSEFVHHLCDRDELNGSSHKKQRKTEYNN